MYAIRSYYVLVPNMIKFIGDSKQKSADASAKSIYNAASAAATKVLSDGGTLIAGPITSDSTVFDSDAAATEPTLSQYMTTIRGTFSITLNSHGVVSVTYTDTDGTTTSTYTG